MARATTKPAVAVAFFSLHGCSRRSIFAVDESLVASTVKRVSVAYASLFLDFYEDHAAQALVASSLSALSYVKFVQRKHRFERVAALDLFPEEIVKDLIGRTLGHPKESVVPGGEKGGDVVAVKGDGQKVVELDYNAV